MTSRLDSCNSLLFGLPDKLIHRLQLLHHRAAPLIKHTQKHDHSTPVMRSLHWLPVRSRIIFKILLLVYKSIHGLAPAYLSELIKPYAPESNLQSGMKNRLIEPLRRLVTFGDQAFYKAGPTLFQLILNLRCLRRLTNSSAICWHSPREFATTRKSSIQTIISCPLLAINLSTAWERRWKMSTDFLAPKGNLVSSM